MQHRTHRLPGLVVEEHRFPVPLDHGDPGGATIEVFARVVRRPGDDGPRPHLVFLQGGPGFGAPRPMDRSGWIGRALEDYTLVLLDQRGTGNSTRLDATRVTAVGDAAAQAEFLARFRSDNIVRDCELVRRELCGDEPWSVLGQSYGGFCATRYLSAAPEGLREVFITGGLPPLEATPDEIYARTYGICKGKNAEYYARYPDDVEAVREIAEHLVANEVRLPCGDRLTLRRFQTLGLQLGFSDGFETLHYLFENPWTEGARGRELAYPFLRAVENTQAWDVGPIFSLLHEACYTQGFASNWSAHRLRDGHPEFGLEQDGPLYLTGEMIDPCLFEEVGALRPMAAAAELLARKEDWPVLYDLDALAANTVPGAAAVYANDMYVERDYSLATAAHTPGMRVWLTDEYEHNGLRAAGPKVLGRLIDLTRGEA